MVVETRQSAQLQPRIYESKIIAQLEKLREKLINGIPEQGIPPMDPLELNKFHLNLNEDFAVLSLTTTSRIEGLMSWNITKIKFTLAGLKFEYGVYFDSITGNGDYDVDGTLMGVFPVYGNGTYDVSVKGLNISGKGKIGSVKNGDEQHLFLEKFDVSIIMKQFELKLTGLMNDPQLSELLSNLLSENLPSMIQQFQSQINSTISLKVKDLADSVLGNMTMQDLLGLING